LAEEAEAFRGSGVAAGEDHLQRHFAVKAHLPRVVHHPHPAPTQLGKQFISWNAWKGFSTLAVRNANRRPLDRGKVGMATHILGRLVLHVRFSLVGHFVPAEDVVVERGASRSMSGRLLFSSSISLHRARLCGRFLLEDGGPSADATIPREG